MSYRDPGHARGDRIARMLVAGWSPARRARIRAILLSLIVSYQNGAEAVTSPEMQVVALIDQASAGASS